MGFSTQVIDFTEIEQTAKPVFAGSIPARCSIKNNIPQGPRFECDHDSSAL